MLEVVVDDTDFGRWMRNWGVNAVFFVKMSKAITILSFKRLDECRISVKLIRSVEQGREA